MDIEAAHHFAHSLDEVWAMFLDPESHTEKFLEMGHRDIRVLDVEPGDGALSITIESKVDGDVPAIARKFIHPTNTLTTSDRWHVDGDGVRTGQTTLQVKGVPVTTSAVATVTEAADGDGCDYRIRLKVSLKVPLVGDRIVGALRPQILEQIESEFAACESWLSRP